MEMSKKRNDGFTLPEVLITVAILVIVLAFGIVGVARYRDYLKITELDNIAREIYMAAENRAVLLQNSGAAKSKVSASSLPNFVKVDERTYRILDSAAAAASSDELLPAGSIDPALREGHFFVLYDEATGHAAEVFYAEKGTIKQDWLPDLRKKRSDRVSDFRSNAPETPTLLVGHYQGDMENLADGDVKILPAPGVEVLIENGNELTLTVKFTLSDRMPQKTDGTLLAVKRIPSVRLEYDGRKVDLLNSSLRPVKKDADITISNIQAAEYTWVLDSLETDGSGKFVKQFKDLFTDGSLVFGKDFTVTAGLILTPDGSADSDGYIDSAYYAQGTDNSLFAKGSATPADSSDPADPPTYTAFIANLRHLQNLSRESSTYAYMSTGGADNTASDFTSKVGADITKAEQIANIECKNYTHNDGRELNSNYNFSAIHNPSLTSYDGKKHELRNLYSKDHGGGLFNQTGGKRMTFQHIRLIAPEVSVSHGGGVASAGLVMMLEGEDNTLDDVEVVDAIINGKGETNPAAGGLVGVIGGQNPDTSVTINNCSVIDATIDGKEVANPAAGGTNPAAGGLVGIIGGQDHKASVEIKDCRVINTAVCGEGGANPAAGGLVGVIGRQDSDTSVTIDNCRVFWEEEKDAAGTTTATAVSKLLTKTNPENGKTEIDYKIVGNFAGGLVGICASNQGDIANLLTITNSFAATTIKSGPMDTDAGQNACIGGLVGGVGYHASIEEGTGKVIISHSYADCYFGEDEESKPVYIGGLVGSNNAYNSTNAELTMAGCYAAGFIVNPGNHVETAGLANDGNPEEPENPENPENPGNPENPENPEEPENTGKITAEKCYSVVRVKKDGDDGKETLERPATPMYPGWDENDPDKSAFYLSTTADVTEAVKMALDNAFEDDKPETHVYDLRHELSPAANPTLKLTPPYPFPGLKDTSGITLPHYSDWAALDKAVALELVYYEEYDKVDGKVQYGVRFSEQFTAENPGSDTLTTEEDAKIIRSDGYALAVKNTELENLKTQETDIVWSCEEDKVKWTWTLKYVKCDNKMCWQWNPTETNKDKDVEVVPVGDYTLIPLPIKMVYGDELPVTNSGKLRYILTLAVTTDGSAERVFYFNPHFAVKIQGPTAEGIAANRPEDKNTTMWIRTPRHFYNLSRRYKADNNAVLSYPQFNIEEKKFTQEFDLDYAEYSGWLNASGRTVGPDDRPFNQDVIYSGANTSGTASGLKFIYDGQYHRIRNVFITNTEQGSYLGLFRQLTKDSELKNVVFEMYPGKHPDVGGSGAQAKSAGALLGYNDGGTVENCAVYGVSFNANASYIGGLVGITLHGGKIQKCSAEVARLDGKGYIGGLVGRSESSSDQLINSYAVGYINKTSGTQNVGGLVGNLTYSSTSISNCYAAVRLESAGTKYGLCPSGNVSSSCGWLTGTFKYRGEKYTVDDTYNNGKGTRIIPAELSCLSPAASTVHYDISGEGWKDDYEGKNFPYRTNVTNKAGKIHYGLWPVEILPEITMFYYEQYEDDSYGFYRAIREEGEDPLEINTLNDNKDILRDGYALAMKKTDLFWFSSGAYVDVKYGTEGSRKQVVHRFSKSGDSLRWDYLTGDEGTEAAAFKESVTGTEYVMLPLWKSVHTGERPDTKNYSQYLRILLRNPKTNGLVSEKGFRTFYFNPHFAKALSCPVEGSTDSPPLVTPTLGSEEVPIYVRTARHFYDLSEFEWYLDRYYFRQEHDVNYGTYTGYDLFLPHGEVFEQTVIGNRDGVIDYNPFTGIYDGGGYRLKNVVFAGSGLDKRGLGLFGRISIDNAQGDSWGGCLKNIIYEPGGTATVNCYISMDKVKDENGEDKDIKPRLFVGGLAGSNYKGKIENCAVLGFNFEIEKEGSDSGPIGTFYVGSLVGMNQGGTVKNCFAEVQDLTVPAKTDANADSFAVGALVGSSYGSADLGPALVENCYTVGVITGGTGTKIAGLVGESGGAVGNNRWTIKNSYSAVALKGDADRYNICGTRSVDVKGTVDKCYYLSGVWSYPDESHEYNTSERLPDAQDGDYNITPKTYSDLLTLTIDSTNWGQIEGTNVYPFPVSTEGKRKGENGNEYSYKCYFGKNWPVYVSDRSGYPETSMFYYEKYTPENGKEDYGFYRAIREEGMDPVVIDTLDESRNSEKGGYALAVTLDDLARMDEFTEVKVICTRNAGTSEATETAGTSEATETAGTSEATDAAETSEATETAEASEASDAAGISEAADADGTSEASDADETSEAADTEETSETSEISGTSKAADTAEKPKATETSRTTEAAEISKASETSGTSKAAETSRTSKAAETVEKPEVSETSESFESTFKKEGESLIWNTQEESGEADQAFECSIEGTDYILLPLPESWQQVDPEGGKNLIVTLEVMPVRSGAEAEVLTEAEVHTEAGNWTEVEAGKRTFYFNPYFCRMLSCPAEGSTETPQMPEAPQEEEPDKPEPGPTASPSVGPSPTPSGPVPTASPSVGPSPTPSGPVPTASPSVEPGPTPSGPVPTAGPSVEPGPTPSEPVPTAGPSVEPEPTPAEPVPTAGPSDGSGSVSPEPEEPGKSEPEEPDKSEPVPTAGPPVEPGPVLPEPEETEPNKSESNKSEPNKSELDEPEPEEPEPAGGGK